MASENKSPTLVAGLNRFRKLVSGGQAQMVYIASDADQSLITSATALCLEHGVPTDGSKTKSELAQLCGIEVNCAVCTVIN